MISRRVLAALTTFLAIAAVFGAVQLIDDDGDGTPDSVKIPLPHGPTITADADQNLSPAEQRDDGKTETPASSPSDRLDLHEDMRDESPPGVSPAGTAQAKTTAPGIGPPVDLGGAQNYSCPYHPVRNQSGLAPGVKPSMVVEHFTVSGPGSLPAIFRLFNTSSFGASSNFGIELAGKCENWVKVGRKAWAQLTFNSAGVSIEIVTFDMTRAQWLNSPIIRRGILASLTADLLKQIGAPPRHVDPVGCSPQAGFTDHNALECGNNHTDVGRNFPWDVFTQQVIRAYYGGNPVKPAAPPVTPHALAECKQRNRYRRTLAAGGKLTHGQASRLHRLEKALAKHYKCGRRGNTTVIRRK